MYQTLLLTIVVLYICLFSALRDPLNSSRDGLMCEVQWFRETYFLFVVFITFSVMRDYTFKNCFHVFLCYLQTEEDKLVQ